MLADGGVGGSGGVVEDGGRRRKDLQPQCSPLSLYIMYCSKGRCQMQKQFFILLKESEKCTPIKLRSCIVSHDLLTKDLRACAGRGLKPIGQHASRRCPNEASKLDCVENGDPSG